MNIEKPNFANEEETKDLDVIRSRFFSQEMEVEYYGTFCNLFGLEPDAFSFWNGIHTFYALVSGEIFGEVNLEGMKVFSNLQKEFWPSGYLGHPDLKHEDNQVFATGLGPMFINQGWFVPMNCDMEVSGIAYDIFTTLFEENLKDFPVEKDFRNGFNFAYEIVSQS